MSHQAINQQAPSSERAAARPDGPRATGLDAGFDPTPWQRLLSAVRDAFPARLDTPNPSLALTRVLVEASGYLGLHTQPAPVFLDITRGTGPHTHREGGIDERALLASPTGWNGHLVALADLGAGRWALLDPSADRFDRPIRNLITGGPLLAPAHRTTPDAPPQRALATLRPRADDDTALTYRTIPTGHPGRDAWRTTPWWQPTTDTTPVIRRAAAAVADTLADITSPSSTGRPDERIPTRHVAHGAA